MPFYKEKFERKESEAVPKTGINAPLFDSHVDPHVNPIVKPAFGQKTNQQEQQQWDWGAVEDFIAPFAESEGQELGLEISDGEQTERHRIASLAFKPGRSRGYMEEATGSDGSTGKVLFYEPTKDQALLLNLPENSGITRSQIVILNAANLKSISQHVIRGSRSGRVRVTNKPALTQAIRNQFDNTQNFIADAGTQSTNRAYSNVLYQLATPSSIGIQNILGELVVEKESGSPGNAISSTLSPATWIDLGNGNAGRAPSNSLYGEHQSPKAGNSSTRKTKYFMFGQVDRFGQIFLGTAQGAMKGNPKAPSSVGVQTQSKNSQGVYRTNTQANTGMSLGPTLQDNPQGSPPQVSGQQDELGWLGLKNNQWAVVIDQGQRTLNLASGLAPTTVLFKIPMWRAAQLGRFLDSHNEDPKYIGWITETKQLGSIQRGDTACPKPSSYR